MRRMEHGDASSWHKVEVLSCEYKRGSSHAGGLGCLSGADFAAGQGSGPCGSQMAVEMLSACNVHMYFPMYL